MLLSPQTIVAIMTSRRKPKNFFKLPINFVHFFLEFSTLKIKLECLRMVALNFKYASRIRIYFQKNNTIYRFVGW